MMFSRRSAYPYAPPQSSGGQAPRHPGIARIRPRRDPDRESSRRRSDAPTSRRSRTRRRTRSSPWVRPPLSWLCSRQNAGAVLELVEARLRVGIQPLTDDELVHVAVGPPHRHLDDGMQPAEACVAGTCTAARSVARPHSTTPSVDRWGPVLLDRLSLLRPGHGVALPFFRQTSHGPRPDSNGPSFASKLNPLGSATHDL